MNFDFNMDEYEAQSLIFFISSSNTLCVVAFKDLLCDFTEDNLTSDATLKLPAETFRQLNRAIKKLQNLDEDSANLYRLLQRNFGSEPEGKIEWSIDDIEVFFQLLNNHNAKVLIKFAKLFCNEFYKSIIECFGEDVQNKKYWGFEESEILANLFFAYFEINDEKHFADDDGYLSPNGKGDIIN